MGGRVQVHGMGLDDRVRAHGKWLVVLGGKARAHGRWPVVPDGRAQAHNIRGCVVRDLEQQGVCMVRVQVCNDRVVHRGLG